MAAKKAKKKKRRISRPRRRRRYYRRVILNMPKGAQAWRRWNHDLDTLLHQLVRNPAILKMPPKKLIALAEKFADEYLAMQDRRRPANIDPEWDG